MNLVAILEALCESVTTIEVLPELSKRAKERLDALGYTNIAYIVGDGHQGCLEHAPYDIILVTACAKEVPMALMDQLKENGRMVIPIGHDSHLTRKLIHFNTHSDPTGTP